MMTQFIFLLFTLTLRIASLIVYPPTGYGAFRFAKQGGGLEAPNYTVRYFLVKITIIACSNAPPPPFFTKGEGNTNMALFPSGLDVISTEPEPPFFSSLKPEQQLFFAETT